MESEPESSILEPDEYKHLLLMSQLENSDRCTTSCVSECGVLAATPNESPDNLKSCFSDRCQCQNKFEDSLESQYNTRTLGQQYFDLVHDHERVDYLLMEHGFMRDIVTQLRDQSDFLKEAPEAQLNIDHKYLGQS